MDFPSLRPGAREAFMVMSSVDVEGRARAAMLSPPTARVKRFSAPIGCR